MQKRLVLALVLLGYSALLIRVVVFKDRMTVPEWARSGSEDYVDGGRVGRGGGARGDGAGDGRIGRGGRGPGRSAAHDARLSTSRFAPLHANYAPFKTIWPQLRGRPRWSSAIINLVGNTVLFMPVGWLALLLFRRMTWPHALVVGVAVGVMMEVLEGVLRVGIVDVDDVILNAVGVMCGCGLCRWWQRRAGMRQPRAES